MATGGKVLLLVLSVLGVSSVVGCGKSQRAPNTIQDGVLVQDKTLTREQVQELNPDHDVTVVNAEENIYKIQGAKLAEVVEKMPTAHVEEDLIYNFRNPNRDFTRYDAVDDVIEKLGCKKAAPNDPVRAGIRVVGNPDFLAYLTVEAGSSPIRLSSVTREPASLEEDSGSFWDPLKSLFGSQNDTDFEIHWFVEPAPGSKTLTYSTNKEILVNPDRPGEYVAILLVQNKATGGCKINGEAIGATINKKFVGSSSAPSVYSSQKFFHVPLVNGEEAWELSHGEGVTIAIIDSGVNYNHPDLARNILINKGEIPDNGIDDDGNGYVDDVSGYDFAIGDAYPYDDQSHGTHVAGLAASSTYGIAKKAKILPIKALLPTGSGSVSAIVSSIYYAVKQNVDVINMSLGGEGETSPLLTAALRKAQEKGIIVVAASGNTKLNADTKMTFFTSRDGTNVLSVSATDENDSLTSYSNYGSVIDIAAPGGTRENPLMSAYSLPEFSTHIGYPGTSMASPVAAGVAALVKSVNPRLNAEEVKRIIVNTGRVSPALQNKVRSSQVIDAHGAVKAALSFNSLALTAAQ